MTDDSRKRRSSWPTLADVWRKLQHVRQKLCTELMFTGESSCNTVGDKVKERGNGARLDSKEKKHGHPELKRDFAGFFQTM